MFEFPVHWIPDAYWLRHHQHAIGVTAGVILVLKQIPYILSILNGRTRPNRASWTIWTVLGAVALAAYIQTGETADLWVPVVLVIAPLTVTVLALRSGYSDDGKYDKLALVGGAVALGVWLISGSAAVGLAMALVADFIGTLPTLRKSVLWPSSEHLPTWYLSLLGYTVNLFAIQQWSLFHAFYPVYVVFWCLSVIGAIHLGRRLQRKSVVPERFGAG